MVKVYLDWNVIAQMKNGLHKGLQEIFLENDNLLLPYSTSHISDIFSSYQASCEQQVLINSDLDFISQLTKDNFIYNNGKEIILELGCPKVYYNQLVEEKDKFKDLSLNGLFKQLDEEQFIGDLVKPYLDLLKTMPLDSVFREALENPTTSHQMETLFPGLKEDPTIEGLFQSFSRMLTEMNEDEKYKDLRKLVQTGVGINRDKIFDDKSPYSLIDANYKRLGQVSHINIDNDKYAPKWFNEISNEYLLLDMHGYQEDNVKISKGRKETFKNTTEDAFHAAFASTCNFYVINDKKSYKKTKKVYEKLRINTLVLKPQEFVEYYAKYLHLKDPILNLIIPFELLQNGEYREEQIEKAILRTFNFPYFLFGFFNKMMLFLPENETSLVLLLSRDKPTNGTTYVMEVARLVKEISELCGKDINGLGEVGEEELREINWVGRKWLYGPMILKLVNSNGYFQLYIDMTQ